MELCVPDSLAKTAEHFDRSLQKRTYSELETAFIHKKGHRVEVCVAGEPVIRDGEVVTVLCTAKDITDRNRTEHALRAAHDTFRHLVETSPFGVYAVDADFRLVQVSAGAQKVFKNVRPLLGRDFAEVMRIVWEEPFATEAIGRFRHTLETGEPFHSPRTIEHRHDIGEIESYDWKVERVTLPDGRLGVVCHFYDLSERQRYVGALRTS
jgi:PAS domain-containing protein